MAYKFEREKKNNRNNGTSQLLPVHTLDWNAVKQQIHSLTRMPNVGNRTIGNIDVTAVIVIKEF